MMTQKGGVSYNVNSINALLALISQFVHLFYQLMKTKAFLVSGKLLNGHIERFFSF